jgi:hypothetical protein
MAQHKNERRLEHRLLEVDPKGGGFKRGDDRGLLFALLVKTIEYHRKLLSFGRARIDLLQSFYDL